MTMKQYKQKAAKEPAPAAAAAAGTENGTGLGKGQGTLDGHVEANGKPAAALADVIDQEKEIPASEGAEDTGDDEEMRDS